MEMNFPHKPPRRKAFNKGTSGGVDIADHRALLAYAIARQQSSQSAKIYGAANQRVTGAQTMIRLSFMEERMAFFADRNWPDVNENRKIKSFETGRFRPDLALAESDNMDG